MPDQAAGRIEKYNKGAKVKMKRRVVSFMGLIICMIMMLSSVVYAAGSDDVFYISAGGKQLAVKIADTTAARELKAMLDEKDLTISMTGNSFEQYGNLGKSLTANDTQITAQAGDILLYNSNTICIFYDSNSYSYTRIGKVQNMTKDELKTLLSGENLKLTLSKKSFGEVPNTGLKDMNMHYRMFLIFSVMALAMWLIVIKKRQDKEGTL